MLLCVGASAAVYFGAPQKLGLLQRPADRFFAQTPDRAAAAALKQELAKQGIDTKGMYLYVLPTLDNKGNTAVAVLDRSQGFTFKKTEGKDPVIDYMTRLATGDTAKKFDVQRVGVYFVNQSGQTLLSLTAPTAVIANFARGATSQDEFMDALEGDVDWAAYFEEVANAFGGL